MDELSEETFKYTKKVDTLELQLCPELIDKDFLAKLTNTLKNIRKDIFETYGVPIPPVKITCCDESFSNPDIQIKVFIIGYCIHEINKHEKSNSIPSIIYNTIKHNLPCFITATTIEKIYEEVQKENPTLMTNLKSFTDSYTAVRHVLKNLVSDYIPLNNLALIFENILESYARYKIENCSFWYLSSHAREELAPIFITELLNTNREFLFFDVSNEILTYLRYNKRTFKRDFLLPLVNEMKNIIKENPSANFILDLDEELRYFYHISLKPVFPDLRIIRKEELDRANLFSPFSRKLIKTIDIPIPNKEAPAADKKAVKKTPWIKKIFKKFKK
ncbi:FHIPEP family protein [Treponema bryantii]|uniref:FHIPEP family protein n=1 Tax=Treponema bryantii TaxID=163 RepID=A0A1I3LJF6_9SPIR|nr:FHIPEP family type III secretion protein [Treponema bryantii]SFI84660.1 FHIPEP family protein [Treponema bryantii]